MNFKIVGCALGVGAALSTSLASAQFPIQIGPPGGGVCVGPLCVDGKGNTRVKTPGEILNDQLNSIPGYTLLSDADKRNVQTAVVTTGVIAAVTTDPVTSLVFIKILSGGEGKEKTVAVPQNPNAPPTGKMWNITAACIAQQESKLITAYFNTSPVPDVDKIGDGDTVNLTAPVCVLFKDKSVTSVTIHKSGGMPIPDTQPPHFTYVLMGEAA
jgi:hypothetical protein